MGMATAVGQDLAAGTGGMSPPQEKIYGHNGYKTSIETGVQTPKEAAMCPTPYYTMIRSRNHKFDWRLHLVLYAQTHGQRSAARYFRCARNTVAKWWARFQREGRAGLRELSHAPQSCPHKTKPQIEQLVLAQRARTKGFGGERLKHEFELPCGISAIKRILRQHHLTRKPRRKHQRKQDLRAVKAAYKPFTRFQMDTKVLRDIPPYWPQMIRRHLPKVQYTLRELSCGAQFLAYADEISLTYAERLAERLLAHLQEQGLDLSEVVIQTDNGSEFDGASRRKTDRGFTHTIEQIHGAQHRFIPPGCCNANADVESVHATIETEFYDLQTFADRRDFLGQAATYQLWYNVKRKNRSRGWKSPAELLAEKSPHLSPKIFLLHPLWLPTLILPPSQVAHDLPVHPDGHRGLRGRLLLSRLG